MIVLRDLARTIVRRTSIWTISIFIDALSHYNRTCSLIVTFIRRVPCGRDRPSSLIQILKFSERPYIVLHEVFRLN